MRVALKKQNLLINYFTDVRHVKAYSNLGGLLAVGAAQNTEAGLRRVHEALLRAAETSSRAYD